MKNVALSNEIASMIGSAFSNHEPGDPIPCAEWWQARVAEILAKHTAWQTLDTLPETGECVLLWDGTAVCEIFFDTAFHRWLTIDERRVLKTRSGLERWQPMPASPIAYGVCVAGP